jgi:hypothetical protein
MDDQMAENPNLPIAAPRYQYDLVPHADMLAQQPIAKTWLPRVAPLIDNHECEISSYPERWYTKIPILGKFDRANAGKIAGGRSILKRKETSVFLEKWSNRLIRPPFMGRDQGKLTEAVKATDTKVCWLPNHWRDAHSKPR